MTDRVPTNILLADYKKRPRHRKYDYNMNYFLPYYPRRKN